MNLSVPLLDLQAQYRTIKTEIDGAVAGVFESQQFIRGPRLEECERAIAAYCGTQFAVGVSSGTDALLIALMAERIGVGDEVITTPYSFFATAGCIARVGARPVFADIDPASFNIDPSQIEERINGRTKAIMPVHLFGQMADMAPIMDIAHRHDLLVIEDAAQSIGAEYDGCRAGSIGHYGCFSFFPAKNLGCAGDGGMVVTDDAGRADRLKVLRVHGSQPKYYHHLVGGNFRLDAIHAAVVTVKLRHLDDWTAARQRNAASYVERFQESGLVDRGLVTLAGATSGDDREANAECRSETTASRAPQCGRSFAGSRSGRSIPSRHVFNQFVVRVQRRDELRGHLASRGISTAIYYPRGLHQQPCFADLGYRERDFPECERAAAETLALPVYPELTDQQLQYVVDTIRRFYLAP